MESTAELVDSITRNDPMGVAAWEMAVEHAQSVVLDDHPELIDAAGRISDETDRQILALASRTFLAWHADNWSALR